MSLSKLYQLADSWDDEAVSLLAYIDHTDFDTRELAHYLRTCADELRRVLSEVENKSPDSPVMVSRAGECGDSFGECVNP